MNIRGRARLPSQRRPRERGAPAPAPERPQGRPALDAPVEVYHESVKVLSQTLDALPTALPDPRTYVLELDPLAVSAGDRLVAELTDAPRLVPAPRLDVPRLRGRLRRFHALGRLAYQRRRLQRSVRDSRRLQGTLARDSSRAAIELLRALVAASDPAALLRGRGVDLDPEEATALRLWARPIVQQWDRIAAQRGAVQQQTRARNQQADLALKKAQARTRLVARMLQMNGSKVVDPEEAAETVRLYDEVTADH